jgi:hypothetical protein
MSKHNQAEVENHQGIEKSPDVWRISSSDVHLSTTAVVILLGWGPSFFDHFLWQRENTLVTGKQWQKTKVDVL